MVRPKGAGISVSDTQQDYDVFISYARLTKSFAQQVYEVLTKRGLKCWMDVREMPASVDWWQEIQYHIANSLVFVPIVSPYLIRSQVCNWETNHALNLGKHIVPIEYIQFFTSDVPDFDKLIYETPEKISVSVATNWERLSALNFIRISNYTTPPELLKRLETHLDTPQMKQDLSLQLRHVLPSDTKQSFDFADGSVGQLAQNIADDLVEAIRTDFEYEQRLRPFAVRAFKWQSKEVGYIRGRELQTLVQLRTEAIQEKLNFGELINNYLDASLRAQTRLQRIVVTISVVVAFVVGILGLVADSQRIEANTQRNEANAQRNEANRQRDIAVANEIERNRQFQTLALTDSIVTVADDNGVNPIGLSPSPPVLLGRYLWVSNREGNDVVQFRADTGVVINSSIVVGNNVTQPVTDDQFVYVTSITERTVSRIVPDDTAQVETLAFNNIPQQIIPFSLTRLWVITDREAIEIDIQAWQILQSIPAGRGIVDIVVDQDFAYFSDGQSRLLNQLNLKTGMISSVSLSGFPQRAVVAFGSVWVADSGIIWQIAPLTLTPIDSVAVANRISAPQAIGNYLWFIAYEGEAKTLIRLDPTTHVVTHIETSHLESPLLQPTNLSINHIYDGDGQVVVVFDQDWIALYDTNGKEQWAINIIGANNLAAPVSDGSNLWLANPKSRVVYVIDTQTGEVERRIPVCFGPTQPLFDGANMWLSCIGQEAGQQGSVIRIPAFLLYHGEGEGRIAELRDFNGNSRVHQPIFDGTRFWIIQEADGRLIVYDIDQQCTIGSLQLGSYPPLPYYDTTTGYYWVSSEAGGPSTYQLLIFDTQRYTTCNDREFAPIRTLNVANEVAELTPIDGYLWINLFQPSITEQTPNLIFADIGQLTILDKYAIIDTFATGYIYDTATDSVWMSVSGVADGRLEQWDTNRLEVLQSIHINYTPWTPLVQGDTIWLSGAFKGGAFHAGTVIFGENNTGGMLRLDKATLATELAIEFEQLPSRIMEAGGYIWVSFNDELPIVSANYNVGYENLTALDINTGQVQATFDLCNNYHVPYHDLDTNLLWVSCIGTPDDPGDVMVMDLDVAPPQVMHIYADLGTEAWYPIKLGDYIWIVYRGTGNIAVFDAATGILTKTFGVGTSPSPPTVDEGGNIWIANSGEGTIQRVRIN